MSIKFNRAFDCEYGKVAQVSPLIRRVVAPNPGPFTFKGTGTYIIGRGSLAMIDPGPDSKAHIDALLRAIDGEELTHILITHTHRDHSPAAAPVKAATGAGTYGFGPHAAKSGPRVEEGADRGFVPDVALNDGDIIEGGGWTIEAVHTPGHTSNHLAFALYEENALFPGDHVMGWSTSVISPPDGHMGDYLDSLEKVLHRNEEIYYPTHGAPIDDPRPFVRSFIDHRRARERQIIECIREGRNTIPQMVEVMYADVPKVLHKAAGRSVLAHLIHMHESGRITCTGTPGPSSHFDEAAK